MATSLLYMDDFNVTTGDAQVLAVEVLDDGRVNLVLNQTCFYPRGGGQDWDSGLIQGDNGEFTVEEVRLDEQGIVQHIGAITSGGFAPDDMVRCIVNDERRLINTRLHSAGHVVDLAVDRLNNGWTPGRGAHYPHMSFVEYTGDFDPAKAEQIAQDIQNIVQEVITQGGENEIRFMPVSDMHTVCRHVPANIPANKPARVVIYCGNFGVPCGGTHVRNLSDIGTVTIPKVKAKKGIIKVTYTVEGIN